ncbi:MAG: aldehyde dehydrogenase family protein [Candidatus Omnitrophica bacterium]|nr:aldehyde dehydrogenase family protein [Candidatus Omnitrophota bacterium]
MSEIKQFQIFVDGLWITPNKNQYIDCVNPSTDEVFAQIAKADSDDTKKAIDAARKSFDSGLWSGLSVKERGKYIVKIASLIRENAKELAELESKGAGKTIKHSTFIDVPSVADTFEYFGKIEKEIESRSVSIGAPVDSKICYEPIGVVGAISAWNYPLIFFGWKVAPALITGNSVVYKPSSVASVAVMRLIEIIQNVLPKGVLNVVTGSVEVGEEIARSSNVDMITFTGGTETGQKIMQAASVNTKKLCLELGGKSPNIVFADCNIDAAIGGAMSAIFMNQGQMCTAGSRLLLEDKIYDEFVEKLKAKAKSLKIGDALDYSTEFGPLVSKAHRDSVLKFIEQGKKEGANLVCGGNVPTQKGAFLEPTIFVDVKNSMTIAQQEAFGPVLCVIKFSGEEQAVEIANDSKYGLAAMVWTKDIEKASRVSSKLHCGTVWINTYGGFYNEAPFGGYKQSGFGRELGIEGLLEYCQAKHVCIDKTPGGKSLAASWF